MLKFYHFPGTSALGIQILLEETKTPYKAELINIRQAEQFQPQYLAINPKGKVPAVLREDGSILTEFSAISYWLASKYPKANLFPEDIESRVRLLEMMDYLVSSVHMQGFMRIVRPENFSTAPDEREAVIRKGKSIFSEGLEVAAAALEGKSYFLSTFSIVDAALFYIEYWAEKRAGIELPGPCKAHYDLVKQRSSVQAAALKSGIDL